MIFKGSFKIVQLFGIPVLLHWSFLIFFIWLGYYGYSSNLNPAEFGWILLFTGALFLSILLHEFGHALTARRFHVETKDIILLPIGGVARLNKLPEKPLQEMWVALAGPATNLVIALLLLPYFIWITLPELPAHDLPAPVDVVGEFFFLPPLIIFLNFLLAIFNLIPAFPMDGGRLLRALLSVRLSRLKATRIAVWTGQLIAIGMILSGLWLDRFSYSLIGLFIYFSANREYRWVWTEDLLSKHLVSEVFDPDFPRFYLEETKDTENPAHQLNGLMFDKDNRLAGIWVEDTPQKKGTGAARKMHFVPSVSGIQLNDSLKKAHDTMQTLRQDIIPVFEEEKLAGMLESEKIWEFLSKIPD